MHSATQLLHDALSRPMDIRCIQLPPGTPCRVCAGESVRGIHVRKWGGADYMQSWLCLYSDWICEACVLTAAWKTPMLMPVPGIVMKAGSKRAPNWRCYSVLYDAGTVRAISKGDKPSILGWLYQPKVGPWFAAITDTGQKHTVMWAPVNTSSSRPGRVWFEDRVAELPPWEMVDSMQSLLCVGSKEKEIEQGDHRVDSLIDHGQLIDQFEKTWSGHRGTPCWDFSLWLAQPSKEAKEKLDARRIAKQAAWKARKQGRQERPSASSD